MGKGMEKAAEAYSDGRGHLDRHKRPLAEALQLEAFEEEAEALPAETSTKD